MIIAQRDIIHTKAISNELSKTGPSQPVANQKQNTHVNIGLHEAIELATGIVATVGAAGYLAWAFLQTPDRLANCAEKTVCRALEQVNAARAAASVVLEEFSTKGRGAADNVIQASDSVMLILGKAPDGVRTILKQSQATTQGLNKRIPETNSAGRIAAWQAHESMRDVVRPC